MYLSKIVLSGDQLHNPYEIHRTLWSAFVENPDQKRDFLFRVEQRLGARKVNLLVQSERKPESNKNNVEVLAVKNVEMSLRRDVHLRFMLVANPIKTILDSEREKSQGKPKQCRVPLINEQDQKKWLARKLESAATPLSIEIEKKHPLNFSKRRRYGKIQPYQFQGLLQVQDEEKLLELIQRGVGPAKAFGCGMLSLARS